MATTITANAKSVAASNQFNHTTPIVRSYTCTFSGAGDVELDTGLQGFYIPVGGLAMTGDLSTGYAKVTFGTTNLFTSNTAAGLDPGTGIAFSEVAGGVLPDATAANAKLTLTTSAATTAVTMTITVCLVPITTGGYTAGVRDNQLASPVT